MYHSTLGSRVIKKKKKKRKTKKTKKDQEELSTSLQDLRAACGGDG